MNFTHYDEWNVMSHQQQQSRNLSPTALLLTGLIGLLVAPAAIAGVMALIDGRVLVGLGLVAIAASEILFMTGLYQADWPVPYYGLGALLIIADCATLQFVLEAMAAGH